MTKVLETVEVVLETVELIKGLEITEVLTATVKLLNNVVDVIEVVVSVEVIETTEVLGVTVAVLFNDELEDIKVPVFVEVLEFIGTSVTDEVVTTEAPVAMELLS